MRRPRTAGGGCVSAACDRKRLSAAVGTRRFQTAWALHHRRHQPIKSLAAARRQCNNRHALDLRQHAIDFFAQPRTNARLALDQVNFIEGDDDRAAFALDKIGNPDVLFFKRRQGIDQDNHDFGKTDGIERIGDRQFLELLLDARAAA